MTQASESPNLPALRGQTTLSEIFGQPSLWPDTLARMQLLSWSKLAQETGVISGAGSSAYAAAAIQAAWPGARAIPTTELILDLSRLENARFLLSIARSGDSPESIAVIKKAAQKYPEVAQFAITCNPEGKLAQSTGMKVAQLNPRTNDQSLVMTSSFSNLVLAGLSLSFSSELDRHLGAICERVRDRLPSLASLAAQVAKKCPNRAVVLASPPLFPWAQESSLKIMEMTSGRVAAMAETYLGLRHGPMSFIDQETLVLCLVSVDSVVGFYERDLISELRAKGLGRIIGIAPVSFPKEEFDVSVGAVADELPDLLRTPFEIIFPQLLAYELSLRSGLDPDSPSPDGIITRVVPGIHIH